MLKDRLNAVTGQLRQTDEQLALLMAAVQQKASVASAGSTTAVGPAGTSAKRESAASGGDHHAGAQGQSPPTPDGSPALDRAPSATLRRKRSLSRVTSELVRVPDHVQQQPTDAVPSEEEIMSPRKWEALANSLAPSNRQEAAMMRSASSMLRRLQSSRSSRMLSSRAPSSRGGLVQLHLLGRARQGGLGLSLPRAELLLRLRRIATVARRAAEEEVAPVLVHLVRPRVHLHRREALRDRLRLHVLSCDDAEERLVLVAGLQPGNELADGWHGYQHYQAVTLGGDWAFKTGRYLKYPYGNTPVPLIVPEGATTGAGVPHQHLLVSVAQAMGLSIDHVGLESRSTPTGAVVDFRGPLKEMFA